MEQNPKITKKHTTKDISSPNKIKIPHIKTNRHLTKINQAN